MAEVRAHDPAAAWQCAQRPSSALEAEVGGRVVRCVQGYHPQRERIPAPTRHRLVSRSSRRHSCSCSGTHSRNDAGGARWCDVARLVTCTAGASSSREGSGGGLCGRAASVRETAVGERREHGLFVRRMLSHQASWGLRCFLRGGDGPWPWRKAVGGGGLGGGHRNIIAYFFK